MAPGAVLLRAITGASGHPRGRQISPGVPLGLAHQPVRREAMVLYYERPVAAYIQLAKGGARVSRVSPATCGRNALPACDSKMVSACMHAYPDWRSRTCQRGGKQRYTAAPVADEQQIERQRAATEAAQRCPSGHSRGVGHRVSPPDRRRPRRERARPPRRRARYSA